MPTLYTREAWPVDPWKKHARKERISRKDAKNDKLKKLPLLGVLGVFA